MVVLLGKQWDKQQLHYLMNIMGNIVAFSSFPPPFHATLETKLFKKCIIKQN